MTYVVTDKCVNCKYTDCVEVCPVDAFHEGENTLVINPSACIDCSLCESECPIEAIIPDTDEHELMDDFIDFAEQKSDVWPIIVQAKAPFENADNVAEDKGKWELRSQKAAQNN
ncbi:MAG: ferredoxin family protein [Neptunomonas phycophila]|uniref:ferredoxin FdxA n=1 Tax=Neptunomonas phycophila TaxID=1572645 RepID=UPI003B8D81DD